MSNVKDQKQMRDDIAGILEISRASWKAKQDLSAHATASDTFPQSMLFKTVSRHPLLSTAAVASIWYFGPAKFGAMAIAGGSLIMRHHLAILPLMQRFFSGSRSRTEGEP